MSFLVYGSVMNPLDIYYSVECKDEVNLKVKVPLRDSSSLKIRSLLSSYVYLMNIYLKSSIESSRLVDRSHRYSYLLSLTSRCSKLVAMLHHVLLRSVDLIDQT